MLAHFSLPTPSEPTYKEREEELRYSCDCCGFPFNRGFEIADDTPGSNLKWRFREECYVFSFHLDHMMDKEGIDPEVVAHLTTHNVKTLY